MEVQIEKLKRAGALVETSNDAAARYVGRLAQALDPKSSSAPDQSIAIVDLSILNQPLAAINVGLQSFTESLTAQEAHVIQVDWKPAAGGNEKLMGILERMKVKS